MGSRSLEEAVEVDERGHEQHRTRHQRDEHRDQGGLARRGRLDREPRRQACRGTGPRPSRGGSRRRRATTSRGPARSGAAPAARSTPVPRARTAPPPGARCPNSPSASRGASPRSTKRPPSPTAPVTAAVPSARSRNPSASSGWPSCSASSAEEDRREVGAGQHGEHAAERRGGVDPARHDVAGRDARRHPPGRDAADDRAQEVRRDQRRDRERRAEEAPHPQRGDALAERERRPAGDHAERGERQRHVQRGRHRREPGREPGPQHHQHEDQPDVVGLPHRPDRVLDHRPLGARRRGCRPRAGPRCPRRSRRPRTARRR